MRGGSIERSAAAPLHGASTSEGQELEHGDQAHHRADPVSSNTTTLLVTRWNHVPMLEARFLEEVRAKSAVGEQCNRVARRRVASQSWSRSFRLLFLEVAIEEVEDSVDCLRLDIVDLVLAVGPRWG